MSSAFAAPRGAKPQQSAMFWLAVRLSMNVRGAAAARLVRLSAGTALASLPSTVWLAAALGPGPAAIQPDALTGTLTGTLTGALADALPATTWLGLALATVPGAALTLWASRALAADRAAATEALRQVGAERTVSWLLPAVRVALAAALGALAGSAIVALLRETAFRDLPGRSPLRLALTAASAGGWVVSTVAAPLLLAACALFASGAGHRLAGRLRPRGARPVL
jgi:hypothetical protein